jgi:pantothenate kinase
MQMDGPSKREAVGCMSTGSKTIWEISGPLSKIKTLIISSTFLIMEAQVLLSLM